MTPHAELHQNGLPALEKGVSSAPQPQHINGTSSSSGRKHRSQLARFPDNETFDIVCVGFGPSSLALAIALHDSLEDANCTPDSRPFGQREPRVLFLERQHQFAWHAGMLLPGAKMQISFLKDLATLRNPRSHFTFINYLRHKRRLVQFSNLDTFLPERIEYEDYMRWCAGSFDNVVEYGHNVIEVSQASSELPLKSFRIHAQSHLGTVKSFSARNVIVSIGGRPRIPSPFSADQPRVLHSSAYAKVIGNLLPDRSQSYRVAIVGAGQSAAEIFNDLHSRYPNARTFLVVKGNALRPSDDSPFVNEIFDPDRVDAFFQKSCEDRTSSLSEDRGTNYGVVRSGLLEHIYATLYRQRIYEPKESKWQHKILTKSSIVKTEHLPNSIQLLIKTKRSSQGDDHSSEQVLDVDVVVVAAGYAYDAHYAIMDSLSKFRPDNHKVWTVGRDYKVNFRQGTVDRNAGIFLQGCNEATHGLSDTLLSILAVRAGEVVSSIFGDFHDPAAPAY